MSLTGIKDALNTQLSSVTGVVMAFRDTPGMVDSRAPENAECPAILAALDSNNSYDTAPIANGLTQYVWHFNLTFFYAPANVGSSSERERGAEPFPTRIRAQLNAHNTLSNACTSVKFGSSGKLGYFTYAGMEYYGLQTKIDILEDVAETYAP